MKINKLFLSVGHHPSRPGAKFESFTEFDEANRWVEELKQYFQEDEVFIVPVGVLKDKVDFINQRCTQECLALEIHFNCFKRGDEQGKWTYDGRGSETLYYPGSSRGVLLAEKVQSTLAYWLPPDRGVKEGYYRLNPNNSPDFFLAKTKCTALIVEPEFIHHKDTIQSQRGEVCKALAQTLRSLIKGD